MRALAMALVALLLVPAHVESALKVPGLEAFVQGGCVDDGPTISAVAAAIRGEVLETKPMRVRGRGREIGRRHRLRARNGSEIRITRLEAPRRGVAATVELWRARKGGEPRPSVLVALDATCRIVGARRLKYARNDTPARLDVYRADLKTIVASEPFDPKLPTRADPGGVAVALVDSGVDYRITDIAARLARDDTGNHLGYDYWDLDERPFDMKLSTPFLARRQGTRTASILLSEAPVARLVAYRYPRPDMSRMRALVDDAAAKGVAIVNVSVGSTDPLEWSAFADAARAHPHILFVASAGNGGADIDARPIFPAALALDNLVTVTSSEADGRLASSSNYGVRTVHLATPGERRAVVGFGGVARIVSGSSYAAARISALAACLVAAHPSWGALELKRALAERARPTPGQPYTSLGYIPDPTALKRGACAAQPLVPTVLERIVWRDPQPVADGAVLLRPELIVLEETGWSVKRIEAGLEQAARILDQCEIGLRTGEIVLAQVPPGMRYVGRESVAALFDVLEPRRPAVVFMRDSTVKRRYSGLALVRSNTQDRQALASTVLMVKPRARLGIVLAHELVHVLLDSSDHDSGPTNLMAANTRRKNTVLRPDQCEKIRASGLALGLLTPAPD